MQGLLTCDVTRIPCYGAMLSPNGRFLYDFFVVSENNHWLIEYPGEYETEILKKFKLYRLKSDIQIDGDSRSVYAVWGEDLNFSEVDKSSPLYVDPRHSDLGFRLYSNQEMSCTSFLGYEDHRIALGIPSMPHDLIHGKSIILECNFVEMKAVSFTKGCYIGQELISRTHHTGVIRKKLIPIKIRDKQLKPFSKHEKGEVRSVGLNYAMIMHRS